ncbi:hypothetical protein DsansV1_C13g0116921 [Dioscorea sansibarensis]
MPLLSNSLNGCHAYPCHHLGFSASKGGPVAQSFPYHGAIILGQIGEGLKLFTYIP